MIDIHPCEVERFQKELRWHIATLKQQWREQGISEERIDEHWRERYTTFAQGIWEDLGHTYIHAGEERRWEVWRTDPRFSPDQVREIDALFDQYKNQQIQEIVTRTTRSRAEAEYIILVSVYPKVAMRFWDNFQHFSLQERKVA